MFGGRKWLRNQGHVLEIILLLLLLLLSLAGTTTATPVALDDTAVATTATATTGTATTITTITTTTTCCKQQLQQRLRQRLLQQLLQLSRRSSSGHQRVLQEGRRPLNSKECQPYQRKEEMQRQPEERVADGPEQHHS